MTDELMAHGDLLESDGADGERTLDRLFTSLGAEHASDFRYHNALANQSAG